MCIRSAFEFLFPIEAKKVLWYYHGTYIDGNSGHVAHA